MFISGGGTSTLIAAHELAARAAAARRDSGSDGQSSFTSKLPARFGLSVGFQPISMDR